MAFNEPGSTRTDAARVVTLGSATRAGLVTQFGEACPTTGITLGLQEISAAREVVLLVTGAPKAEMLAQLARGPATSAVPASWLVGHPDFRVLADEAGASRLG